ncbi:MAG: hypothetical protein IKC93_08875 [Candidatus Methanomethylophilaceae archaeon]|nr:hypothetical protein [Candidatus Methanomethylophilaceae archaeon]MBR7124954.1 hypothetical protein [Candidatus Methanomethylophilaceae archaeon]
MFGIVGCPNCKRTRIIDLETKSTKCPFCGKSSKTDTLFVKFSHYDAAIVREVFQGNENVPFRKEGEDADPMKALAYRVSHCKNIDQKLQIIAEGLCDLKGEFTEEDVETLIPGKGTVYTEAMLERCIIHEIRYGRYTI